MEQACTLDEYPLCCPLLMLDRHAPMQSQGLFDHCVHTTLESACRLWASSHEIREEVLAALQFGEEVVGLPEPIMRLPPLLPGG